MVNRKPIEPLQTIVGLQVLNGVQNTSWSSVDYRTFLGSLWVIKYLQVNYGLQKAFRSSVDHTSWQNRLENFLVLCGLQNLFQFSMGYRIPSGHLWVIEGLQVCCGQSIRSSLNSRRPSVPLWTINYLQILYGLQNIYRSLMDDRRLSGPQWTIANPQVLQQILRFSMGLSGLYG